MTGQEALNKMRIKLGETDVANSRWDDDPHLLFYLNNGRREFCKESLSVKNIFKQTTTKGPTVAGDNEVARYLLDPLIWDIDELFWDGYEVELDGTGEWQELTSSNLKEEGVPYTARRIGDSIDLYYAPNEAKTLEIHASILVPDITDLTLPDPDLKDDQLIAAINHGAWEALEDDDREGSKYLAVFKESAKRYKKKVAMKGSRLVNIKNHDNGGI